MVKRMCKRTGAVIFTLDIQKLAFTRPKSRDKHSAFTIPNWADNNHCIIHP